MNTDFWRIAEDARIAAQAHDAQRELKELARQYRDEINIKVGWMIAAMRSAGAEQILRKRSNEATK